MQQVKSFFKRHRAILALLAADTIIFFGINPRSASSLVLMLGLLLAVGTIYALMGMFLGVLESLVPVLHVKSRKIKVLLTLVIAFLVGLQSVGQLTAKDVIAIIPFLVVGYFYLMYPDKQSPTEDHK
ncbi:MAG TPA: hypothetical protein VHD60_00920 [Candidatus Saccharimonadales bacterium]|nr:hypothetical protein [Candidatus Saccharimonadales bacterium]